MRYFKYPVNTRLQGKDQLINNMYDHISAFQIKLGIWEQKLRQKTLLTFLHCHCNQTSHGGRHINMYASLIFDLNLEFENRFQQDFKKHHMLF